MKGSLPVFSLPLLILLVASGFFCSPIKADERILSFHSDIEVRTDGSMEVRETIRVRSEGNKIRRGIYRDFPTRYKDHYGNNYQVKFKVTSALRNGITESFHTENKSNGVRVYLGNKNHLLTPDEYTYTIVYHTDRQLGFFEKHDELYWNATGNGWIFPIDEAVVRINLPGNIPAESLAYEAYTGPAGAKGKNYHSTVNHNGIVEFLTTHTLSPREGITIVTTWPKGYIDEPDFKKNVANLLEDNTPTLIALAGCLMILAYYFYAWKKVGIDPENGVIFPHYFPPEGFSPASMRYISRMGYDHKTFASAIVNLAVKGALSINEYAKKYTLSRTTPTKAKLAAGESILLNQLFSEGKSVTLVNTNHQLISKTINAHKQSLRDDFHKIYFRMNSIWLLPGLITSIGFIIAIFIKVHSSVGADNLFMLVWLTGWTVGVVVLTRMVFTLWKAAFSGQGFGTAIGLTLFSLPFLATEIFALSKLEVSYLLILIVAAIISLNILFYHLLKAPTRVGRKLLDKIEGFKMYLDVAEKDELNMKNPPDKTPEIFEAYLASAMALDVEQHWAEKFSSVFNRLQRQGKHYQPSWYHGSHWSTANLGGFTSAVGSNLSSAISSSSTAPGSSSGSGGGGSSGGGGGGGGGGGW